MPKKIITWVLIIAGVAAVLVAAHMFNLVEVIRKMHGM